MKSKKFKVTREIEHAFSEVYSSLQELINEDPQSAILKARSLIPDGVLGAQNIDMLKASTLIDAGVAGHDGQAVKEGVTILRGLSCNLPAKGDIEYCLAIGLSAQADFETLLFPDWYLKTAALRREARQLYLSAGVRKSTPSHIAAKALINLGNSLLKAYRSVEAYDSYLRAFAHDPTNGVALANAASILLHFADRKIGDPSVLRTVAAQHKKKAQGNPERLRTIAGEQNFRTLSKFLESEIPLGNLPDLSTANDYQQFVAEHRLALSLTIEGLDLTLARWDSLCLACVSERTDTEDGVPPIFAMFNILKSDYLAARFLAYTALYADLPESGRYADTLDYGNYGIQQSVLALAQRSCFDLLDKIAVATSEYLDLPGSSNSISFMNRWFQTIGKGGKKEPLLWQPQIQEEIQKGNTALIALSEVSGDIELGGFLRQKQSLRHSSTHRFIVMHQIDEITSRKCAHIDHYETKFFVEQLVETLQLVRAALFYFVELIGIHEQRIAKKGDLKIPLFVPDHDRVRGDD